MRFAPILLLLSGALSAGAQVQADSLPVGARVQVHGLMATPTGDRAYYLQGLIVGGDSRHLIVSRDNPVHVDTLPFFAMSHLELSQGQVSRGQLLRTATLTGASIGAAAYLAALVLQNANGDGMWKDAQKVALASIPLLAGIGLVVGTVSNTEKWVSIRIPGAFSLPTR